MTLDVTVSCSISESPSRAACPTILPTPDLETVNTTARAVSYVLRLRSSESGKSLLEILTETV